jgi:MMP endo-(1,4)-3-O-methyl-alpha-D-mannosidase
MLKPVTSRKPSFPIVDINATTEFILSVQKKEGEIPWSVGGKTDPWDHVESAMGLVVGGCFEEAKKAYLWSAGTQLEDGSWWAEYFDGLPRKDAYKDTNMTAYFSVGVLHYYMATGDLDFLRRMWDTVNRSMDFVLSMQGLQGEMFWAKRQNGSLDRTSLLTGSSSIYLSLGCALGIADLMQEGRPLWERARVKLGNAIRYQPDLFDRSKSRFSMDWYYPVLCGVITGERALERLRASWETFIVPDWGVLCVSDQPWVTMAESSELAISLALVDLIEESEMVLDWIQEKRYEDGAFWTGVTFPDGVIYTEEKTAWTAAAVLLATDLLYDLSPAGRFFKTVSRLPHPHMFPDPLRNGR